MESKNFCSEKFLEEYDLFLNQLEGLFEDNDDKNLVSELKNSCESDKLSRGILFYRSLEDVELFDLFCKSKVKLFSTKDEKTRIISNSLLGDELPLKKLINNQNERTKDIIWKYLHLFYFLHESDNSNRKTRKSLVSKLLKDKEEKLTRDVKNELLNVNVNEDTNNMIEDIVKSFEKSLSGENANPFESIMEITQNITSKYNDKIESGEIELDKLMGSIQNNIPGMPDLMKGSMGGLGGKKDEPKEKVIIDEDFSTDNVELGDKEGDKKDGSGMNLSNMLKMMNSMNGGAGGEGGGPDLGGLFSMLGKLDSVDNEEDAAKLKSEMDTYLEKELGVDIGKLNQQMGEVQEKMNTMVPSKISSPREPDQD
jgi:hypothetical protein